MTSGALRVASVVLVSFVSATAVCWSVAAQLAALADGSCDQQCLEKAMAGFVVAMTTGKAGSVPLAEQAEIRENAKLVPLAGGRIVRIDNIGLMMQGVTSLGFSH